MIESAVVTKIFLILLVSKGLIEAWLDSRQKNNIRKNQEAVPERFKDSITLSEHQKAADYTVAKLNSAQFFNLVGVFILLIWTLGGGLKTIDQLVALTGVESTLWQGVIFIGFFSLINGFLGLPQSIYSTFVLEERFGFNKTTVKTFIMDMVKGTVLGICIGLPMLLGILWIMNALGSSWWFWAWAFMTVLQLGLVWAYPTFIAPLFNKFYPMEDGETKNRVEALLSRTDFHSKGLFVMDASMRSSHGNAYFTGFGKSKRIVFFDTLLKSLEPAEVEAVLAHELGHFKKKHILKGMVKALGLSLVGFWILGQLYQSPAFFEGLNAGSMSNAKALLLFMLVAGVFTFPMTPISAWLSRKNEFEADEFAAKNARAQDLITALVKLYKENANTLTPDPIYSAWYHSHPPALIRVNHLEKLS
ncbi:MAG: peptidase M48 [Halobacteriovorax sp.]|nr:peptidase M48 [Halobacteriovorax sp.]